MYSEKQETDRAAAALESGSNRLTPPDQAREAGSANTSPQVKIALLALRIYKVCVSPWLGGGCRFQPTCSVYMAQAIERFGALSGVWLGLKRLGRCQPFSKKFGYDPVPEKQSAGSTRSPQAPAASSRATPKEAHL